MGRVLVALAAGLILALALIALLGSGTTSPGLTIGGPGSAEEIAATPCAGRTAATTAAVDMDVARRIYSAELHSSEVSADIAHVTGSAALLGALESHNEAAVRAAVYAIVYAPYWHIVRLRVVRAGRVLADVGGPDVIAPVSGPLRVRGRTLARYVLSVQDDLGYVKLVTRFIGIPIDLYRNGAFVMGTLRPAPAAVAADATVQMGGASYRTRLLSALAFPSGRLGVSLFIPSASPALEASSCDAVRAAAWRNIAAHIAARFHPLGTHYEDLAHVLRGITGYHAYVFDGSRQLAGPPLETRPPSSGSVRYGGRSWSVVSIAVESQVRVYLLTS